MANARWASRRPLDRRYREEVRHALKQMAGGVERCMYCEDSAGHAIEHFWPRSRFPERAFCWENLLLTCDRCNNHHKRTQFPLSLQGEPLLVDPTAEEPGMHLELRPREGLMLAREGSAKGETTIGVLGLNRYELRKGRKIAWTGLQALVERYGRFKEQDRAEEAALCAGTLTGHPFPAVLEVLLRTAERADAEQYVDPECLAVLRSHGSDLRALLARGLSSQAAPVSPARPL
ncbi:hypothetical protein [Chondromyces apiculatus]|nr:hypothetical protein [Chondromyces apiculatus]